MRRIATLVVACGLACAAVGGCAPVRPWERGTLAQPAMSEEPDPEGAAFDAHLDGARESALDPSRSGGGGCGCN